MLDDVSTSTLTMVFFLSVSASSDDIPSAVPYSSQQSLFFSVVHAWESRCCYYVVVTFFVVVVCRGAVFPVNNAFAQEKCGVLSQFRSR